MAYVTETVRAGGTHRWRRPGEVLGGGPAAFSATLHWLRVRDGQAVEHWADRDGMARLPRAMRQARKHDGE